MGRWLTEFAGIDQLKWVHWWYNHKLQILKLFLNWASTLGSSRNQCGVTNGGRSPGNVSQIPCLWTPQRQFDLGDQVVRHVVWRTARTWPVETLPKATRILAFFNKNYRILGCSISNYSTKELCLIWSERDSLLVSCFVSMHNCDRGMYWITVTGNATRYWYAVVHACTGQLQCTL